MTHRAINEHGKEVLLPLYPKERADLVPWRHGHTCVMCHTPLVLRFCRSYLYLWAHKPGLGEECPERVGMTVEGEQVAEPINSGLLWKEAEEEHKWRVLDSAERFRREFDGRGPSSFALGWLADNAEKIEESARRRSARP